MADKQKSVVYEKGRLYQINLNELLADPNQPRKSMDADALEELAASVGKVGVIQPIVFRLDDQGNKVVVAGERRVAAARMTGLAAIPAIFISGNYSEIALVENLLRQDLTAVEEAEGLQALMTGQQYTQEQLAGIIGKARTTLNEILSLNKLPQEIRDDCRCDRTIARSTLIDIARKKQTRAMTTAYNAYKTKQQKGKATRTKRDANAPDQLFVLVDKALVKLNAMDMSAWSAEDKANFQTLIANLKQWIDNYLAAPSPSKPSKRLA